MGRITDFGCKVCRVEELTSLVAAARRGRSKCSSRTSRVMTTGAKEEHPSYLVSVSRAATFKVFLLDETAKRKPSGLPVVPHDTHETDLTSGKS